MSEEHLIIVARLLAAALIGALIGFERPFHGRPSGFRTHSLVCVSSALLMLVTVQRSQWMTGVPLDAIRTDPTRMTQGIMTGIGFLGAGAIFREGLTVRGLTTAASIWMTVAIGILVGTGSHFTALVGATLTLTILRCSGSSKEDSPQRSMPITSCEWSGIARSAKRNCDLGSRVTASPSPTSRSG